MNNIINTASTEVLLIKEHVQVCALSVTSHNASTLHVEEGALSLVTKHTPTQRAFQLTDRQTAFTRFI